MARREQLGAHLVTWHCKQIPNGDNPLVVCERETLMRELEAERKLADALAAALERIEAKGKETPDWEPIKGGRRAIPGTRGWEMSDAALNAWRVARSSTPTPTDTPTHAHPRCINEFCSLVCEDCDTAGRAPSTPEDPT